MKRIGREQPAAAAARSLTTAGTAAAMRDHLRRMRTGITNTATRGVNRIRNTLNNTGIRIHRYFTGGRDDYLLLNEFRRPPMRRPLPYRIKKFIQKHKRKIAIGGAALVGGGAIIGGIAGKLSEEETETKMHEGNTGTLGHLLRGGSGGGGGGGSSSYYLGARSVAEPVKRRRRKAKGKKAKTTKRKKHVKRIGGKHKKVGGKKRINKPKKSRKGKKQFAAF